MSKRAGRRKRGKRKPHRNRKSRPLRRNRSERLVTLVESLSPPSLRITIQTTSPGTPLADEGHPRPARTVAEIPSWSNLEMAIEILPSPAPVRASSRVVTDVRPPVTPSGWESDADVLLLDSPGQNSFGQSPKSPILKADPFLMCSPVMTPKENLKCGFDFTSPLFRYRESPECIFSADVYPAKTSPTPSTWADVLEHLKL
jgi:hypothetical protein